MFTIDLLKGQGIPVRSRPEGIVIAAVTFSVPAVAAVMMTGLYLVNRVDIAVASKSLARYEQKVNKLADQVQWQESIQVQKSDLLKSLDEVKASIYRHAQWSPVLVTVVRNMPDSMILDSLGVTQRSVKKKIPDKNNPAQTVDVSVPQRTLRISVSGLSNRSYDKEVRDFSDRLRFSPVLKPRLEDIRVSQDFKGGENRVSYTIECIFKPEL